jgi:hypothetical protein
LVLIGLLFYAMLRVAYVHFYKPLGLSPDDLGLGYAQLLAQAAIGVAALLVAAGFVLGLYAALYAWMLSSLGVGAWLGALLQRAIWSKRSANLLGTIAVVIAVFGAAGAIAGNKRFEYPDIALGGAFVGVIFALAVRRTWREISGETTIQPANWWLRGVAGIVVLALASTGAILIANADQYARRTQAGLSGHPEWWGIQLASWGAEAATVSSTTDKVGRQLTQLTNSCVMYLGESGGTLFVYLPYPPGPRTYRIPTNAAAVTVVPGLRCRQGVPTPTR